MTGHPEPTPGWQRVPGDAGPDELFDALYRTAKGWLPAEAAVGLLRAHGTWLKRQALRAHMDYSPDDGGFAAIRWRELVAAIDNDEIPGSGSERAVLQLACSLCSEHARWSLWELIGSLDAGNLELVMHAMAHARDWHERREHPDDPPGISRLISGGSALIPPETAREAR